MPFFQKQTYLTPGVYREDIYPQHQPELMTGVPVFIGLVSKGECDSLPDEFHMTGPLQPGIHVLDIGDMGGNRQPSQSHGSSCPAVFRHWPEAQQVLSPIKPFGYLVPAVRGFFENGGRLCLVQVICFDEHIVSMSEALACGIGTLEDMDSADLVCVPDIVRNRGSDRPDMQQVLLMQRQILAHCDRMGDRFAILDPLPGADAQCVLQQRAGLKGNNGALYYPWIKVPYGPEERDGFIPPCGHIAGIYSRCDEAVGVHKAPANEVIEGTLDTEVHIGGQQQARLNPAGINCIRVFPGRGIRIYGARTLSGDPAWVQITVTRIFLTFSRWIERNLADVVFETNDHRLWARIRLEVTGYLNHLFEQGALRGDTPAQAFYVKCDQETNPQEVRDRGMVITEVGLAPTSPCEFIIVRIIHGDNGTGMEGAGAQREHTSAMPQTSISTKTGPVRISFIRYSPAGRDVSGEYVLIENRGTEPVDMGNWTLSDRASHIFRFPQFVLAPGTEVRIWTKDGTDSQNDLYWGSGTAIWNNQGDTATLCDREGNVVDRYKYLPRHRGV